MTQSKRPFGILTAYKWQSMFEVDAHISGLQGQMEAHTYTLPESVVGGAKMSGFCWSI